MKEVNKKILQKAIKKLPVHKAPDYVWDGIECKIVPSVNSEILNEAINDLPQHKAPDKVWTGIENLLDTSQKKGFRIKFLTNNILKMAAVIALLIGFYFLLKKDNSANKKGLQFSTEIIESIPETKYEFEENTDLSKLINEYCTTKPNICKSKEYMELNNMLNDIKIEEENLKALIKDGNKNQLNTYYTRIINEKIKIQKEILQLII